MPGNSVTISVIIFSIVKYDKNLLIYFFLYNLTKVDLIGRLLEK